MAEPYTRESQTTLTGVLESIRKVVVLLLLNNYLQTLPPSGAMFYLQQIKPFRQALQVEFKLLCAFAKSI